MSLEMIPANDIQIVENECNTPAIDENLALYDPAVDYPIGQEVVILEQTLEDGTVKKINSVFVSLDVDDAGKNIGNNPIESKYWIFDRPTNLYSSIDRYPSSKTKKNGDLVMVYTFMKSTDFFLLGLRGDSIKIEQIDVDTGDVLQSLEQSLLQEPYNCFEALTYCPIQKTISSMGLEFKIYQKLRVTITGQKSEIGVVVAGKKEKIGCMHTGIVDDPFLLFPPKRDKYGQVTEALDNFIREVSFSISVPTETYTPIKKYIDSKIGIPCLYIPLSSTHITTIFGYTMRPVGTISYMGKEEIKIKVESLKYEREEKRCL